MADHGLSTYTNHGCRCDLCRAAMTAYCRNRRKRIRGKVPPEAPHGLSTYTNYGCRCRSCRDANAEAARAQYWRKKEAAQPTT